ncbi:hypothetical protein BH09SUM1_BH09SUM1_15250 [soil metagenome]
MSPTIESMVAALAITLSLEIGFWRGPFPRTKTTRFPSLALGIIAGLCYMAYRAPEHDAQPAAGRILLTAAGAGVRLLCGAYSDRVRPSTRRHFSAAVVAGILVFVAGGGIRFLAIPGHGVYELPTVVSLIVTCFWVFLVIGTLEICSMLPLLAGAAALLVGMSVFIPYEVFKTYIGLTLCGTILGAMPGRVLGELITVRSHAYEKAEVLVLGYLVACATLSIFLKSIAGAFIIPVGLVVVAAVILTTHSLDRSLILRAKPRG